MLDGKLCGMAVLAGMLAHTGPVGWGLVMALGRASYGVVSVMLGAWPGDGACCYEKLQGLDMVEGAAALQMGVPGMSHPVLLPGMPGGPGMLPGGPGGVSPAGNGRMDMFPHMAQPPVGMPHMPSTQQQVPLPLQICV